LKTKKTPRKADDLKSESKCYPVKSRIISSILDLDRLIAGIKCCIKSLSIKARLQGLKEISKEMKYHLKEKDTDFKSWRSFLTFLLSNNKFSLWILQKALFQNN